MPIKVYRTIYGTKPEARIPRNTTDFAAGGTGPQPVAFWEKIYWRQIAFELRITSQVNTDFAPGGPDFPWGGTLTRPKTERELVAGMKQTVFDADLFTWSCDTGVSVAGFEDLFPSPARCVATLRILHTGYSVPPATTTGTINPSFSFSADLVCDGSPRLHIGDEGGGEFSVNLGAGGVLNATVSFGTQIWGLTENHLAGFSGPFTLSPPTAGGFLTYGGKYDATTGNLI